MLIKVNVRANAERVSIHVPQANLSEEFRDIVAFSQQVMFEGTTNEVHHARPKR